MELFPLNSSSLAQQEHSPACEFPDTGLSFPEHLCCTFPVSPGSALLTVFPHRQNLTTLLQFKPKYLQYGGSASCSVDTCCTEGMMAVIVSRTFKKLFFFYESIIDPALKPIFFALMFQFQPISSQIVNMQLHEQCS